MARRQIKRNGKVIELSRFLMQEQLGRKLQENEVVHHIDGNKLNDSIENLEVMTRDKHVEEHYKRGDLKWPCTGAIHRKQSKNPNEAWCSKCKKFLAKELFNNNNSRWNKLSKFCKKCNNEACTKSRRKHNPNPRSYIRNTWLSIAKDVKIKKPMPLVASTLTQDKN